MTDFFRTSAFDCKGSGQPLTLASMTEAMNYLGELRNVTIRPTKMLVSQRMYKMLRRKAKRLRHRDDGKWRTQLFKSLFKDLL